MIPLTTDIWISRSTAFNDLLKSFKIEAIDYVIIYVFGLCMVILAFIGFTFYLWNLKSSNEHTQRRLLNILHGYLSVACMGCSPAVFNLMLQVIRSAYMALHDTQLWENTQFDWSIRVTVGHFIATSPFSCLETQKCHPFSAFPLHTDGDNIPILV